MDKRKIRFIALFLIFSFLINIFSPTVAFALTGGPNSPEFSSFEPVATTDMVNPLTGDFTYNLPVINVPGPDGSGYPLSLSYHSGVSSEEEASWVGFGWTLSPGAINRSLRGFPDDYKNVSVTQYNKVKPNWSASITADLELEFKSKDKKKKEPKQGADTMYTTPQLNFGVNHSLRFNNYQGFSASTGFNSTVSGITGGVNISGGEVTFSAQVNPLALLNKKKKEEEENVEKKPVVNTDRNKKFTKLSKLYSKYSTKKVKEGVVNSVRSMANVSSYGIASFGNFSSNVSVSRYSGISYDWSANVKVDIGKANVGFEAGYSGNFNIQANHPEFIGSAYGFMYNPDLSTIGTLENTSVVSDYYVEKGNAYSPRDHFIGMPFNNADNFVLSGEGLNGGFQLFHKKIGHYYPNFSVSKQRIKKMALEFTIGISTGNIVDVGVGFDFNVPDVGQHKVKISDWKDVDNICGKSPADYQFDPDDKGFFRFTNDLGGFVQFSNGGNTEAVSAAVSPPQISAGQNLPCIPISQIVPGVKKYYPEMGSMGLSDIESEDFSVGGSSKIDFHTFPVAEADRYEKDQEIKSIVSSYSSNSDLADRVAELSITNESGLRYIYGLPVYSRNEKNLQLSAEHETGSSVEHNYLYFPSAKINSKFPLKNKTVTGESKDKPYATTYLLTQICTPDYVNIVDPNAIASTSGAGPEDFGGWTKFGYRTGASFDNGLNGSWYHYRTPYTGLLFNKNSISYDGDDVGSVSMGEKQVYYLKTIETKTHIAFFVTNKTEGADFTNYIPGNIPSNLRNEIISSLNGSMTDRPDGLGAKNDITEFDPASVRPTANTNIGNIQKLEKLERIVLYAKTRFEKPLQTTHFEYDNSLVRNLPNSIHGAYPFNPGNVDDYEKSGKLTLRRVWFEYEGTVPAKISPYVFNYLYRTDYTTGAADITKYHALNEMLRYSSSEQNPDYRPETLDNWGNFQLNGDQRQKLMQPWVSQIDRNLIHNTFDPAAWQLKQIILPSGGEINIQYEEGDYCYVQDRNALAMVSLLPVSIDSKVPEDTKYFLNLADIGLSSLDQNQLEDLVIKLKYYFGLLPLKPETSEPQTKDDERKKIFFKFLYALKGNEASLDNCKSEYITGYTSVNDINVFDGKIFLSLGTKHNRSKKNIPKWVAYSFLSSQKNGFVDNNDCKGPFSDNDMKVLDYYHNGIQDDPLSFDKYIVDNEPYDHGPDADPNKNKFKKVIVRSVLGDLTGIQFNYPAPLIGNVCEKVNFPLSYLRIPLLTTNKKGGGIRVKRILMYDDGGNMDSGDVGVFGTEYSYINNDGMSSGVATNEPSSEENALKTFLPRLKQSFFSRIIAGRDKEQAEGPLGESLLPAPTVVYSRVVEKNIHKGETSTGYKVTEYYTTKDFPYDHYYEAIPNSEVEGRGVEYTDLTDNKKKDKLNLPLGLFNYRVDKRWAAQGFRFIINNMNGQIKKTSTYGEGMQMSSYTEYNYFNPGEKVPMIMYDPVNENYKYELIVPGKEEQITTLMSSYSDIIQDLNLELDLVISFTATGATAKFGAFPSFTYSETEMNTHATTKVLRYPAILRSVTNYQDGVTNTSEYIAFNPHNGKPVVTKTTDGYDKIRLDKQNGFFTDNTGQDPVNYHSGTYYSLSLPASWIYPQMGQKSKSDTPDERTNQLSATAGTLNYYGYYPFTNTPDPTVFGVNPNGLISASVQTYSNNWFSDNTGILAANYNLGQISPSEQTALNSKWYPKSSYNYRADVSLANVPTGRIYNSGLMNDFSMFDWGSPPSNSPTQPWVLVSSVTKYSPNGIPLEDKNLLNIFNANKFGPDGTLLMMSANNASYSTISFDDFENYAPGNLITSTGSHSGNKSLVFTMSPNYQFIQPSQYMILNDQLKDRGALVKIWVKSEFPVVSQTNSNNGFKAVLNNSIQKPFMKVAQSGEWTLYEAKFMPADLSALSDGSILTLSFVYNATSSEIVYMDDFRFSPLDASVNCYSYDIYSRRLTAQYDDQHFGLYFQYNNEGKLVRKLKETEKGMKTLQETQYNTPAVLKGLPF